jgi:hypothetical protein
VTIQHPNVTFTDTPSGRATWGRSIAIAVKQLIAGEVSAKSYTVTTLPSAATAGQMIYISNESGGAVLAFSDGTNWRRVTDRAIVS